MESVFAQLVEKAAELNWCARIYCTTCGSRDFRDALEQIAGDGGFGLVEPLSSLEVKSYVGLRDWDDCLRIAFLHLPFPGQRERVLTAWLENLGENIHFADVVLFYLVRALPSKSELRESWTSACASLACASKNESLIESLVWTLRSDVSNHADLFGLAQELSASSFKVRRALFETGALQ